MIEFVPVSWTGLTTGNAKFVRLVTEIGALKTPHPPEAVTDTDPLLTILPDQLKAFWFEVRLTVVCSAVNFQFERFPLKAPATWHEALAPRVTCDEHRN